MKLTYGLLLVALLQVLAAPAFSQSGRMGLGGGVGYGAMFGITDTDDRLGRFQARGFVRYGVTDQLEVELGGGVGKVAGLDYQTLLFPIDARLVFSPFQLEDINPFVYAGVGALYYKLEQPNVPYTQTLSEWTGYAPVGAGIQFQLQDRVAVELSGGYGFTLSDKINGVEVDEKSDTRTIKKDSFASFLLGLTVTGGESGSADPDNDGLTNNEEKQLGTDSHNADTDGDGLSDGDEVNKYRTAPLKADSDGDGLKDGEEVTKYKTDPNKADTDGDGLSDGDEITKYGTDALKADTDGDGLNDGQEVTTYKTDPLKSDTDGDGLNDSAEVLTHKTDPLKKDTDGGTVNDGDEIARRSDPLNPSDDVPKKEEIKVEVGKAIVLEGIVFKTASAEITPESERNLEKALNTLSQNPEIEVEIHGYTDNVGNRASNVRLSQSRADAVKAYLVSNDVAAQRITTKGYGPDNPIAPNDTPEGRQQNRRIEFFRVK